MSESNKAPYHGSCLCGAIKYTVTKIEPHMAHCHCSMCRKFHGAAFATFGEAKKEHFRWLQGEQLLSTYTASNGAQRSFCSHCGASLIFKPSSGQQDVVEFALGTLDTDINLQPDAHIFVTDKVNWIRLDDDLKRYNQSRS